MSSEPLYIYDYTNTKCYITMLKHHRLTLRGVLVFFTYNKGRVIYLYPDWLLVVGAQYFSRQELTFILSSANFLYGI